MGEHPPVDFPVFRVSEPVLSPVWLAMIAGEAGRMPYGIEMAHGARMPSEPGTPGLSLATFPANDDAPVEWALHMSWRVYGAALSLLVRTDIDFRTPTAERWRAAAEAFNEDPDGHHEQWRRLTWTVEGVDVTAYAFELDDSWVAYTAALEDVMVSAIGGNLDPDNLVLVETDGTAYGVDFSQPLHFRDSIKASRAHAGLES